jgi:hypothetical protein
MQRSTRVTLVIGLALVLGFLTGEAIPFAAARLPASGTKDLVTDLLSLPGGLAAAAFYRAGRESGSTGWIRFVIVANCVFFSLVWYGILSIVAVATRCLRRTQGVQRE